MGFWDWLTGAGAHPNATVGTPPTVGPQYSPGDPDGVEILTPEPATQQRMAVIVPSGWDGLPAGWAPQWSASSNFEDTVDTAWAALDLNSSVLSSMPVYRMRNGQILEPTSWMTNPDPTIYTGWAEFSKQLFWDYQAAGEAFVLPMAPGADGWPLNFRVIPPPFVTVEMNAGIRRYWLGGTLDVTDDILHIRYKSRTDNPHGVGPLESGRNRLIAAGVLSQYVNEIAEGGWIPPYFLETDARMSRAQTDELLEQYMASRMASFGQRGKPGVLSSGLKARSLQLTPEQLSLVDLSKWNESRISVLLGVPPILLGLPSGGDSMTYKNVDSLFDFHDRAGLKPKVTHVMQALSGWALPRGQTVELNRDEYTRPSLLERATADEKFVAMGALSVEQVQTMERFTGSVAAEALTGGAGG